VTGYRNLNPNTQGILCLLVALVFLTFSDSIIKWLSPRYALHEIMLYRGCFAILVVLAFIKLEGGLYLLKTRRPWLHLLRGGLLVVANMFFFLGLASLPLAETVALFFVAPLFICILSQPVLGEKVGAASWVAIFIGLAGVIVMVRPGADVFKLASVLPILAAFTYAAMQMVTRKLGMQEKAGTLTFYIQVAFIIISIASGLLIGDGRFNNFDNPTFDFLLRAWTWPSTADLWLLVLCGVIVAFGGYFLSQAYRLAQAPVVAPFEYGSMPVALAVGFYLWGDWPDRVSMAGSALIIFSGLLIIYFENRARSMQSGKIPDKPTIKIPHKEY
jgi:drug/metabolite transporter (DMT)-like permease